MSNGVSRREFLKYSLATGALIATGEGIVNRVMAQAPKGITEVDKLIVWVLTDNYYDANRADIKNTKRYRIQTGEIDPRRARRFFLRRNTSRTAKPAPVCSISASTPWACRTISSSSGSMLVKPMPSV